MGCCYLRAATTFSSVESTQSSISDTHTRTRARARANIDALCVSLSHTRADFLVKPRLWHQKGGRGVYVCVCVTDARVGFACDDGLVAFP